MDQTLQKSTELGVVAFQPLITERVEVRIRPEKLAKRMEHWRKVVISACEQSGRATIPALDEPVDLIEWLDRSPNKQRLLLEPGAGSSLARTRPENRTELLVGPEGGFSEKEVAMLSQNGVLPVSLGPRILRTETAGPAAIAILQALAGDLQ
jgi:16S rRNA (uracil1498-N3)-methyltransferase